MDCVKLGDHVILKDEKNTMLHHLQSGRLQVKYYKSKLDLTNSIGNPYWSWYLLEPRGKNEYCIALCENKPEIRVDRKESGIDNRNIKPDQTSQLLSNEELVKMKEDGMATNSIIQNLIDNSKSFALKTEYSQEKYLSKKSKKYSNAIQILKPTITSLANIFLKGSLYLGLRWDTLSQITTSLDMRGDKVYILYENHCQGVVGATLLNLLGKEGKIVNIATPLNVKDKKRVFNAMQFENETLERFVSVKYEDLVKVNRTSKKPEFKSLIKHSELGDCNNLEGATESKRRRSKDSNDNSPTSTTKSFEMKHCGPRNNAKKNFSNEVNEPEGVEFPTNLVTPETKNQTCIITSQTGKTELFKGTSIDEIDRKDNAGNDVINSKNRVTNTSDDVTHRENNATEMFDDVIIQGENNAVETSDCAMKRENNATVATDNVTCDVVDSKNRETKTFDDVTQRKNNATDNAAETSGRTTKCENNATVATDDVACAGNEIMETSNVIPDIGSNEATRKRKLDESFDDKSTFSGTYGEILSLCDKKVDGLVIVCKENPRVILKSLLKLVIPSRNFVVYSQYKETLVNLYGELIHSPSVIRLRLFDNFTRNYQVLPERTHPLNSMDGNGGYLLTGTVVEGN